jgi:hypothetical protein
VSAGGVLECGASGVAVSRMGMSRVGCAWVGVSGVWVSCVCLKYGWVYVRYRTCMRLHGVCLKYFSGDIGVRCIWVCDGCLGTSGVSEGV